MLFHGGACAHLEAGCCCGKCEKKNGHKFYRLLEASLVRNQAQLMSYYFSISRVECLFQIIQNI